MFPIDVLVMGVALGALLTFFIILYIDSRDNNDELTMSFLMFHSLYKLAPEKWDVESYNYTRFIKELEPTEHIKELGYGRIRHYEEKSERIYFNLINKWMYRFWLKCKKRRELNNRVKEMSKNIRSELNGCVEKQ